MFTKKGQKALICAYLPDSKKFPISKVIVFLQSYQC